MKWKERERERKREREREKEKKRRERRKRYEARTWKDDGKEERKENNKQRMAEGREIITKTGLMKFNLIILFPTFFTGIRIKLQTQCDSLVFHQSKCKEKESEDEGKELCVKLNESDEERD